MGGQDGAVAGGDVAQELLDAVQQRKDVLAAGVDDRGDRAIRAARR
jgi:hypothetical protein